MSRFRLIFAAVAASALAALLWWLQPPPEPRAAEGPGVKEARRMRETNPPAGPQISSSTPRGTAPSVVPEGTGPATSEPPSPFARRQQWERSGYEAAGEGAEAAVRELAHITTPADRRAFLRGVFSRLGEGSASAEALQAFKQLRGDADREVALRVLVETWNPPRRAEDELSSVELSERGNLIMSLAGDPALAAEVARTAARRDELGLILGELARQDARTNPQRALSFGEGLQGEERAKFLASLAVGWGEGDGAAAWAWANQEPDAALRASIQAAVLQGMASHDPVGASQRLAQLTGTEARQAAIRTVGVQWGSKDTASALQWAQALPAAEERTTALAGIRESAPVGIGAVLTTGPDGLPTIREVVPGGAASTMPQLAQGSRIASIRDASGQSIDLQGKNLTEAVSLLRGAPGTSVTFEIIPAGRPATERQVVVLKRRQLLFKRE